jgi:hypothetical protein
MLFSLLLPSSPVLPVGTSFLNPHHRKKHQTKSCTSSSVGSCSALCAHDKDLSKCTRWVAPVQEPARLGHPDPVRVSVGCDGEAPAGEYCCFWLKFTRKMFPTSAITVVPLTKNKSHVSTPVDLFFGRTHAHCEDRTDCFNERQQRVRSPVLKSLHKPGWSNGVLWPAPNNKVHTHTTRRPCAVEQHYEQETWQQDDCLLCYSCSCYFRSTVFET